MRSENNFPGNRNEEQREVIVLFALDTSIQLLFLLSLLSILDHVIFMKSGLTKSN
jgi:hypothetical protein